MRSRRPLLQGRSASSGSTAAELDLARALKGGRRSPSSKARSTSWGHWFEPSNRPPHESSANAGLSFSRRQTPEPPLAAFWPQPGRKPASPLSRRNAADARRFCSTCAYAGACAGRTEACGGYGTRGRMPDREHRGRRVGGVARRPDRCRADYSFRRFGVPGPLRLRGEGLRRVGPRAAEIGAADGPLRPPGCRRGA